MDEQEVIKVELTAEISVSVLSDEDYETFLATGDLPEYVWEEIQNSFLSNITSGYCWIGDEQNYINI